MPQPPLPPPCWAGTGCRGSRREFAGDEAGEIISSTPQVGFELFELAFRHKAFRCEE
jgi:hypothetical protein